MNSTTATEPEQKLRIRKDGACQELHRALDHAAHFLPCQGPIEIFVHHNTLHAFEQLPFHEALRAGQKMYGANPYLLESEYRAMIETGRITVGDLEAVLEADLGEAADEPIAGLGTRGQLRLSMFRHPIAAGPDAELRWIVAETDALERFRDEVPFRVREELIEATQRWFARPHTGAESEMHQGLVNKFGRHPDAWKESTWETLVLHFLWRTCLQGVSGVPIFEKHGGEWIRPRDVLLHATGEDTDRYVHELLIRFCSTFLDQGYADWNLPDRDKGLYQSFISVYRRRKGPPDRWMRGRVRTRGASPIANRSRAVDPRFAGVVGDSAGKPTGIHHANTASARRMGGHALADGDRCRLDGETGSPGIAAGVSCSASNPGAPGDPLRG